MDRTDVLEYAKKLAGRLRERMRWEDAGNGLGYWKAARPEDFMGIVATATQALEFFRIYAGADSAWSRQAEAIYQNNGERQSKETGARALGDLLEAWVDQVEHGVIEIVGERIRGEVAGARMDLMEQVRLLLQDRNVHPAAPIVLCGAALEIAMRVVTQTNNITVAERPTMNTLITALRQAGLLTKQDVKELETCAGLRNQAAHGDFGSLSHERAGLMEQQTGILLRRLEELPPIEGR
ncbi:hypothetical protein [Amycolatopsis japonica]|uniref:hypothetical protein n=1 Tax=Amycolatopsis japonica TaxID=208439 RepID=UPI0033DD74AA